MTPEQLRTLKQSFSRIEPYGRTLNGLFRQRFFAEAPQFCRLFGSELDALHGKFTQAVAEMARLPLLSFPATGIADTEAVAVADFAPLREALIWALVNCPDIAVTEAEREAWEAGYDAVIAAMSGLRDCAVPEGEAQAARLRQGPGRIFLKDLAEREDAYAGARGADRPSLAAFLQAPVAPSETG
jgi:hypothetical protein